MKTIKLDKEERELLDSIERGEWKAIPNEAQEIRRLRGAARQTLRALKKDTRVNVRVPSGDLDAIRARAMDDGIPYQTLIASILHRYVNGRLVDAPRRVPGRA